MAKNNPTVTPEMVALAKATAPTAQKGWSTVSGTATPTTGGTTTVNTTVADPQVTAAYQGVNQRVNQLAATETKQMDPTQLQRRIGLATASTADAAAGQAAAGAARAAQLGRPELAGLFARRANEQAQRSAAQQAQTLTAEELSKLDQINESRRNALTEAIFGRENASLHPAQLALEQQRLAQTGIGADRSYQLQQAEMRQQAQQFNAQLQAQQQYQQAQLAQQAADREFARQQALAQMTMQTPVTPVMPTSSGGGFGGGGLWSRGI